LLSLNGVFHYGSIDRTQINIHAEHQARAIIENITVKTLRPALATCCHLTLAFWRWRLLSESCVKNNHCKKKITIISTYEKTGLLELHWGPSGGSPRA